MSKSKAKGTQYEIEVRDHLVNTVGNAYRCGEIVNHPGDVSFKMLRNDPMRLASLSYFVECKRRASSWAELYKWLCGKLKPNDFLFIRADRESTLVVMRLEQFDELIKGDLPKPRRGE